MLETPEPRPRRQHRRTEPQKHTKDNPFSVFHSNFYRHYATFFEIFGLHQRVSPSFASILGNTMNVKKIPKCPTFYNFEP